MTGPGARGRSAGLAGLWLAVCCLCACGERAPPPPTGLDDPRLVGADPDGSRPLTVRLDLDEERRWNDMDAPSGITLLGAARVSPDLVKVYLTHRTTRDGLSDLSYTVHALDCRARRMRLVGTGALDDASLGRGADATIAPWPRAGAAAAIFDKACDNRFRCDLAEQENPCNYEMMLSIERRERRNAIEDVR